MDSCRIWDGGVTGSGYGWMWDKENKRYVSPHRFYFEKLVGPIPEGLCVCHKCDNKLCVNPEHLFLGTQKDNMQDCAKKNRLGPNNHKHPSGEKLSFSKLTNEQVKLIRCEYTAGSGDRLAARYNVSASAIYAVMRGRTWKEDGYTNSARYGNKFCQEQIDEIRSRFKEEGGSFARLARKYGVHRGTIGRIIKGKTWRKREVGLNGRNGK